MSLLSLMGVAQEGSSASVFSPYTMYGLGDLSVGGNISSRLMGGIGVASRRADQFNYQNPASMSAIAQKSAIFNFGAEGYSVYSQTQYAKTSYNNFNIHDLGLAFPLARGIGLGFSLTPVSSVGYSSTVIDNNPSVIENIGRAVYDYSGQGGVSQVSAHFGAQLVRGLSIGATASYNFGVVDRYYNAELYSLLTSATYRSIKTYEKLHVSQFNFTLGLQYTARVGAEASLTLGVTYVPRISYKADHSRLIASVASSSNIVDTVSFVSSKMPMAMPEKYAAGLFFSNRYIGVGIDYSRQNWQNAFQMPEGSSMKLRDRDDVRFGIQYTPDRFSIRSAMSRWTYKLGFRYANSYMMRDNYVLNEYAVSVGADIPLKVRSSSVANVGFEFGQRGAKMQGQVFEQYWRVFVGVSLFGDEGWFQKRKFN